jgi:hypothetical protein
MLHVTIWVMTSGNVGENIKVVELTVSDIVKLHKIKVNVFLV